jgi:hypothetical protein
VAVLVERGADRGDAAVHHVARADRVGAGGGVRDGRAREQLERRVVVHLVALEHAAVAVRGVFAETDIRQQHKARARLAERPQRTLDDAIVVPGAGTLGVLLVRDPEQQHRAHAQLRRLLGLGRQVLDREPAECRQVRVRLGGRADEERQDEVVEVDPGLPHERPQAVAAAEPAQARDRERAHTSNLRAPTRASPPKTTPSATSQRPSRSTAPQGLRS